MRSHPAWARKLWWRAKTRLKAQRRRLSFRREFNEFKKRSDLERLPVRWSDRYPCFFDSTPVTSYDRHYVYHTAWAARVLATTKPSVHVDIGSYLYFASLVSAFVPLQFYDYRPARLDLPGLETHAADLLSLPFKDNSISSLSCMHVVEHVGLGRYGDRLDPDGDLKAIRELQRVLAPNGNLLFVVPVGKPKVMFNAHRIYSYNQVMEQFRDFRLMEFALIHERGDEGLLTGTTSEMVDAENYGCGCFWFKRPEEQR